MNNKELLNSLLETVQLGQIALDSALKTSMRASLRRQLEGQLKEYSGIETEAFRIAAARGWTLEDIEPAAKFKEKVVTRLHLSMGGHDSRLAALIIQNNTTAMINGLRNLHQSSCADLPVSSLCQKLLDSHTAAIRHMQGFL